MVVLAATTILVFVSNAQSRNFKDQRYCFYSAYTLFGRKAAVLLEKTKICFMSFII